MQQHLGGYEERDESAGLVGDDRLEGGSGNDWLSGGDGTSDIDTLYGDGTQAREWYNYRHEQDA